MLRLFPFLLSLLVASPVLAQDPITPGHTDLDASIIEAAESNYSITVKQGPMEQPFGTVAVTRTIDDAGALVTEIRAYEVMGQKLADTTVAAWPSLAAISHISNTPQRTLRYTVADGMISGAGNAPGGEPEAFEMSVDGPVFDSAWMSTLVPALPLEDGYEVTIIAFEDDEAGLGDYALSTSGPVDLALPNGLKFDVWEVEATGPGGEIVQYFYDINSRALLRIAWAPQPGVEVFIDVEMGESSGK